MIACMHMLCKIGNKCKSLYVTSPKWSTMNAWMMTIMVDAKDMALCVLI